VLGESILLLAVDTSPSFAFTAEQFVTQSVQRTINIDPQRRELTRAAHTVDYGGKKVYRADYKQSSDKGGAMYLGYIFTKFRAHLIGITLSASSPEALDESANVLQKIVFRDDQPNPACVPGTNDGLQPGTGLGVLGSVVPADTVKPGSRVRVSSGVSSGLLVKRVEPQYPEAARNDRIEGTIILSASISELGNVETVELVSGDRTLAPAAIEAVKQWKYKPFLLNGTPMTMLTQVVVEFRLPAN
jgi:TonB family protein